MRGLLVTSVKMTIKDHFIRRNRKIYQFTRSCAKFSIFLTLTFIIILTLTNTLKSQLRSHSPKDKVIHINFAKIHKCGSETLANIFFRFGLKYNLTFALPKKGVHVSKITSVLPLNQKRYYDILMCHSVYSRDLSNSLFAPDTVNIAIIREPANRMISAAYYYRDVFKIAYLVRVPKHNFIENLVERSEMYDRKPFSRTKNSMGKDFGFSHNISINDIDKIEKHIKMLKADFKLILVRERFDESLILMKRMLNWDIEDIIYLQLNHNIHEHVIQTPNITKKLHKTCFLDYTIYKTFTRLFDEKVKAEGQTFPREVKWFKHILKLVNGFCDPSKSNRKTFSIEKSEWNERFTITLKNCAEMKKETLQFLPQLRKRHKKMNL